MIQVWHRIKKCLKRIRYGINPKYRPFRQVRDRYRAGLSQVEADNGGRIQFLPLSKDMWKDVLLRFRANGHISVECGDKYDVRRVACVLRNRFLAGDSNE